MARSGRTKRSPNAPTAGPKRDRAAPLKASDARFGEGGRRRPSPRSALGSPGGGAPGKNKVHVFISYVHGDGVVAAAVKDAVVEVDRDRVECFLDSASIESGEGWKNKLDAALAKADWLVCIYTGEQSQWCGYEVGVFLQNKAQTKAKEDGRLVCLHDADTAPGLFATTQNKLIKFFPSGVPSASEHAAPAAWSDEEVQFYRESNVFHFLSDFCEYKGLYPVRDRAEGDRQTQTLLAAAKRITLAFEKARGADIKTDTPTQLKLEVSFAANPPGSVEEVPADAKVAGTFASFALFGLAPHTPHKQLPSITWAELKAECLKRSAANALWMESLEQEMASTMQRRALGPPKAIFSAASDGRLYRPILVRHVVRYNGTNEFDLVFVQALPRQFAGLTKTSLLLAGLVQASRFRFTFLEEPERVAAEFDDARSDEDFAVGCRQLRYDIDRIESEAVELGVLDHNAFIAAFGERRRAQAEGFVEAWAKARAALLPHLPEAGAVLTPETRRRARAAVAAFLASMEGENREFVLAALDAYREEVAR